jgi:hypothetical protein
MKLEITIPTDLSEITLGQYMKFITILEDNQESEFLQDKLVQIFCNVDLKYIAQIKRKQIVDIVNTINGLFVKVPPFKNKFTLNGVEYGFIPNLDEMTQGEYMDLDNYIFNNKSIDKAMAVMFRPIINKIKDKYLIESYEGSDVYSEKMLEAPIDVFLSARVFFYRLGNDLLKSTLTYLEQNPQIQSLMDKHNLASDGDGTPQFMHLLREMSEDLTKFPDFRLINV